jgi:hypothetical protein
VANKPPDGSDVDEFLRESRLSLTGEYWKPVDSLVPVRLVDMREEPAPEPPRRKMRTLDVVVGAAGLLAALVLVVMLGRSDAHPAAPTARRPAGRVPAHSVKTPARTVRTPAPAPSIAIVVSTTPVASTTLVAPDVSATPAVAPGSPLPSPQPRHRKSTPGHVPPTASFPD